MHTGEQWIDNETGEPHTVTWWDEGKYSPWEPWHTSIHMIWATPLVIFLTLVLVLVLVHFLR